jgi:hypothetical protein
MNPFETISQPNNEIRVLIPTLFESLQEQILAGAYLQIVPKGSKGIIINKELSQELQISVNEVITQMQSIPGITSQETATTANAILKRAKNLVKDIENERKKMDQLLNDEKADNKAIEASIVGQLAALVQVVNNNITRFQEAEEAKAKAKALELQRIKDEEMAKAQQERDRVSKIKGLILKFESEVILHAQNATIDTIDTLIAQLKGASLSAEVYQEFHNDALKMYQESMERMEARKVELVKYAELERTNKAQAEELKAQQEAKAKKDAEELAAKNEAIEVAKQEQEMSDAANIQMEHELKTSMNTGAKGVQKRWTFDEESIDMSLLPDEFKTYDKEAITKAIASGRYQIDGVKIYQKIINTSR